MDIYLQSLTFFIVLTIIYFMVLKPTLTIDKLGPDCFNDYKSSIFPKLALYLLAVCLSQFLLNTVYLNAKCGGSSKENIGIAALYTFIPWTVIFGTMIAVLIIFPGFKSAFSDVIGYYWISNQANDLLVELLMQQDVENSLEKGTTPASSSAITGSPDDTASKDTMVGGGDKEAIREVADLILKLCGNTSILINQMTPRNFEPYWSLLTPLKKPKYQNDTSAETQTLKKQLFDLTVTRDNIGETLWYIYTGLLLTSIVQLKITTRGCATNPKTMEENYAKFQKQQDAIQAQNATTTGTIYTVTN